MGFPDGFVWGTATSAAQVEGAWDEGGRTPSIWDTFAATPGAIDGGDTPAVAIDHLHRIAEDVDILAALGVDAYRFSISWSRLVPDGTGEPNPEGVAFYRELCTRLREVGVAPYATLYHWDLPQCLHERGGWTDTESPTWFRRFAEVAVTELGDLVTSWSTLNEPFVSAFLGYGSGVHAPGVRSPGRALLAAHNLLVAHHEGAAAMRALGDPTLEVGVVLNLVPAWPASEAEADVEAARRADLVQNELFLDGVLDGEVPDDVAALHDRYGVADRVDVDRLRRAHRPPDLLGMNYYNVNRFRHEPGADGLPEYPGTDEVVLVRPEPPRTTMDWGVEPEGLGWMLRRVADRAPDVPLMVMENGVAWDEQPGPAVPKPDWVSAGESSDEGEPFWRRDDVVHDERRIDYIERHLAVAAEAINDGVDLRGWFVWSLFDNFEWALGYAKTFGLVHVDRDTLQRTPKDSFHWYRAHIRTARNT